MLTQAGLGRAAQHSLQMRVTQQVTWPRLPHHLAYLPPKALALVCLWPWEGTALPMLPVPALSPSHICWCAGPWGHPPLHQDGSPRTDTGDSPPARRTLQNPQGLSFTQAPSKAHTWLCTICNFVFFLKSRALLFELSASILEETDCKMCTC